MFGETLKNEEMQYFKDKFISDRSLTEFHGLVTEFQARWCPEGATDNQNTELVRSVN